MNASHDEPVVTEVEEGRDARGIWWSRELLRMRELLSGTLSVPLTDFKTSSLRELDEALGEIVDRVRNELARR